MASLWRLCCCLRGNSTDANEILEKMELISSEHSKEIARCTGDIALKKKECLAASLENNRDKFNRVQKEIVKVERRMDRLDRDLMDLTNTRDDVRTYRTEETIQNGIELCTRLRKSLNTNNFNKAMTITRNHAQAMEQTQKKRDMLEDARDDDEYMSDYEDEWDKSQAMLMLKVSTPIRSVSSSDAKAAAGFSL